MLSMSKDTPRVPSTEWCSMGDQAQQASGLGIQRKNSGSGVCLESLRRTVPCRTCTSRVYSSVLVYLDTKFEKSEEDWTYPGSACVGVKG